MVGDVRSAGRDAILAEQGAEAAMDRFMGERIGTPPDSEVVNLTETTRIRLRARRLGRSVNFRNAYLLTGAAEQGTTYPAKRTVRRFAMLEPPVEAVAVVSNVAGALTVQGAGTVSGVDAAASGACVVPTGSIGGALAAGTITAGGAAITGNPEQQTFPSKSAAMFRLGVHWPYFLSSELPVQYSSPTAWPNFATMHADTFPVIRIVGDFTPTSAHNGRGMLIVTGVFRPGSNFAWNGVILAGELGSNPTPAWTLRGLIVAGMDAGAGSATVPGGAVSLQYNRCHVMRAFAKLSHLEPVSGTEWTDR
jgi:hypothetical protein